MKVSKHIQDGERVKFTLNETIFLRNKSVDNFINLIVSEIIGINIISKTHHQLQLQKPVWLSLEVLV